MNYKAVVLAASLAAIAACSSETPQAAPKESTSAPVITPATPPKAANAIPMRNFAPIKIGSYDVQPMYEEEIKDGHINIKVAGGEVKAVRIWAGPEDHANVMVVKTEIENDYNHGHLELPNPLPDGMPLWIELETPAGELLKGSTPLVAH
jgi:hypothetical protein